MFVGALEFRLLYATCLIADRGPGESESSVTGTGGDRSFHMECRGQDAVAISRKAFAISNRMNRCGLNWCVCRLVSPFSVRSLLRGIIRRPAARRRSASGSPRLSGLGSSLQGTLQESTPWPWEPGPSLAFGWCDPAESGNPHRGDDHVFESCTLIGFIGADAKAITANNRTFTTLSVATKSSYKDKKTGEYVCTPNGTSAWYSGSSLTSPSP